MKKNFNFFRDASQVLWKDTLWHNALRALAAGVVMGFFASLSGFGSTPGGQGPLGNTFASMVVGMPLMYFFVLLPVGLVASGLSRAFPIAGLVGRFFGLLVAIGDPLVFTLSKFKPAWVPMERPPFFTLRIVLFVVSPYDR